MTKTTQKFPLKTKIIKTTIIKTTIIKTTIIKTKIIKTTIIINNLSCYYFFDTTMFVCWYDEVESQ